jgi:hypothetical protein
MKLTLKNKNINYFVLGIFSVLLCIPLWVRPGFTLNGQDLIFHLDRILGVYYGWQDGQIISQINPLVFGGSGYASSIFYGPFEAIFISGLFGLFRSFYFSYNFSLTVLVFLGTLGMFKLSEEFTLLRRRQLLISFVYLFVPSGVIFSIYNFQGIGQLSGWTFFPFILLGVMRIIRNKKSGILILVISGTIMLTSHLLSTFLICLFCLIFVVINVKKMALKEIGKLVISGILILLTSAFYLLPFYSVKKLGFYNVFGDDNVNNVMWRTLWALNDTRNLFILNFNLDYFKNFPDRAFFNLDWLIFGFLFVLVIIIGSIIKLIEKKSFNSIYIQFSIIGIFFFLIQSILINWEKLPTLFENLQFTFRFGVLEYLCFAIIFGAVLDKMLNKQIFLKILSFALLFLFVIINIFRGYCYTNRVFFVEKNGGIGLEKITNKDNYFDLRDPYKIAKIPTVADYLPKTYNHNSKNYYSSVSRNLKPKVISGKLKIQKYKQYGTKSEFTVSKVKQKSTVQLTYFYYPGYKANDKTGNKLKVSYSPDYRVMVTVPKGYSGEIFVHFGISGWTIVGYSITTVSALSLIAIYLVLIRKKAKKCSKKD